MSRQLKVRTGCSVCKIRRVKCDETKPSCIKCTSTGRTCEGYAPPLPRKSRTRRSKYDALHMRLDRGIDASLDTPEVSIILNSNFHVPTYVWRVPKSINRARDRADQDGSRSLAYYRTRVSKGISTYFDEEFWNSFVLQVSEAEPPVRHAILALSALYEAGETSQLLNPPSSNHRYNYLMRMNTNGPLLDVVLIPCLIFTWIEFLRNDIDVALTHLHSGLRFLCEHRERSGSRMVVMHVAPILGRVLIQATLHRSTSIVFDYYATMGHDPGSRSLNFVTLREARCDLDGKISSVLRFLRLTKCAGSAQLRHGCGVFPDLPCPKCMHQAHIRDFDRWKEAFESLRARLDISALTSNEIQALHQLELSYLLMSNTLRTLFATTPMVFDKYNDTYARVLYLSRQMLRSQMLRRTTSLFNLPFDNSVQGALLNIVLRCRHLPIRREAVQLLQLCPDNEGIWQRASLVAFCNWKIGIEEKGRPQGALETDPLPENARVHSETAREVVRDGQSLVAIRFKRGARSSISDVGLDEEEVPNTINNSMDLWGNVKLPDIKSLRGYELSNSTTQWYDISSDDKVTYASLLGTPIIGMPESSNTSFNMVSFYWSVECDAARIDPVGPWKQAALFLNTTCPSSEPVWTFDLKINSSAKDTAFFTYQSRKSDNLAQTNTSTAQCRAEAPVVELRVECVDKDCGQATGQLVLADNVTRWEDKVTQQGEGWVEIANIPAKVLSNRLQIAINTFWDASIGNGLRTANLSLDQPPSVCPLEYTETCAEQGFIWNTTTIHGQRFDGEQYICNIPFAIIVIFISCFLLLAANVSTILGIITTAPNVLGYVSTAARDNPYFKGHAVPSHIDGMEATRLLQNVRVMVGDVEGKSEVGHVAFTTMDIVPQRLLKRKLYR
ncbi:Transcriptional regulatory protein moc3-like protein 4 [Paraphaeosphaeria sporulosa]